MNHFRTAILLAALTGIFVVVGSLIGGEQGMVIAFLVACAMNLFAYWNADKMVLRMYGAREVSAVEEPQFHGLIQQLARRAGLPMPRVYLIDSDQPNAFATGRNPQNAAVAATTGLLRMLSTEEIAGVMAHELAHVKNRDTLTMTITATIAGAIGMLAQFGMFFGAGARDSEGRPNPLGMIGALAAMIVAPIAAMLVQMAISRGREYEADREGAEISKRPLALASALEKIAGSAKQIPNMPAERNPASAHLFIVNPLSGARMDNLFSTHPNVENRVARLEEIAREMGTTAAPSAAPPSEQFSGPWASSPSSARRGPWG